MTADKWTRRRPGVRPGAAAPHQDIWKFRHSLLVGTNGTKEPVVTSDERKPALSRHRTFVDLEIRGAALLFRVSSYSPAGPTPLSLRLLFTPRTS